jgi:uncharacterized membrane protein YecN with MAPEG domain
MPITAFYTALLALLFIALSARTIALRRTRSVEIGDGGDRELLRRIRVHANFAEYVPMAVLLMGLAESLKTAPALLHAIGALLLAGRVAHSYALSQSPHILQLRVFGMAATFTSLAFGAAACLWSATGALF